MSSCISKLRRMWYFFWNMWKKLKKIQLHYFLFSACKQQFYGIIEANLIYEVILKTIWMRWEGHIARKENNRNVLKMLIIGESVLHAEMYFKFPEIVSYRAIEYYLYQINKYIYICIHNKLNL